MKIKKASELMACSCGSPLPFTDKHEYCSQCGKHGDVVLKEFDYDDGSIKCSCGKILYKHSKFCPCCGSKAAKGK